MRIQQSGVWKPIQEEKRSVIELPILEITPRIQTRAKLELTSIWVSISKKKRGFMCGDHYVNTINFRTKDYGRLYLSLYNSKDNTWKNIECSSDLPDAISETIKKTFRDMQIPIVNIYPRPPKHSDFFITTRTKGTSRSNHETSLVCMSDKSATHYTVTTKGFETVNKVFLFIKTKKSSNAQRLSCFKSL